MKYGNLASKFLIGYRAFEGEEFFIVSNCTRQTGIYR